MSWRGTAALSARSPRPADPMRDLPAVVLWAWERPEDLRFISAGEAAVAVLAKTLYLRGERVVVRPRLQPISYPEDAAIIGVVRIETDRRQAVALSEAQRTRAVSEIARLTDDLRLAAVQVDFDATLSERAFYRDLLFDLRRALPASVRLSITALASWCIHDDWLSGLPIDEAVPMLFRMGADHRQVLSHLKAGGDFRPASARLSLAISTDEPLVGLPSGRRVYIFSPRPWSEAEARKMIEEVKQWQ